MKANVVSRFKGKSFRTVDVPEEAIKEAEEEKGGPLDIGEKLELVFRFGQNEFQPREYPSVTAGDIIMLLNGTKQFYIVESFGFKELTDERFNKLRKIYEKLEDALDVNEAYDEARDFYKQHEINCF
jgi:hypothetical protein